MFDVLDEADLSTPEFARLVDVTRVAAYNWRAGRTKPHKQVVARVHRTLDLLHKLVERKVLPLPADLTREERDAKIAKLKNALTKLPESAHA